MPSKFENISIILALVVYYSTNIRASVLEFNKNSCILYLAPLDTSVWSIYEERVTGAAGLKGSTYGSLHVKYKYKYKHKYKCKYNYN